MPLSSAIMRPQRGQSERGLRTSGRRKAKAAPDERRARPLPNVTSLPLNVVSVHCSLLKALPLVRAAMCSDKSLEAHGGPCGIGAGYYVVLSRILKVNFREIPFHALGLIEHSPAPIP
jgi:hypothetical protein